jgi:hypothetical protein
MYDAHLFVRNWHHHPVLPGEYGLGDGHFSSLDFMVTPPQQPPGGHMTDNEYYVAAVISHYRARVEHINARIDSHAIFQSDWRHSVYLLNDVVTVTTHATAFLSYQHVRYPPYGNWSHF